MISINELCNYDDIKTKISEATTFEQVNIIYTNYLSLPKPYNNTLENALILSLMDETRYYKKVDDAQFINFLKNQNISKIDTQDIVQTKILQKHIKLKNMPSLQWKTKKCPHCEKELKNATNESYVICGYDNKGYDWKGCKKDWCFKCGKKLCKAWDINELYNIQNRYHGKCCKKFAKKNNLNYEDFCVCYKI